LGNAGHNMPDNEYILELIAPYLEENWLRSPDFNRDFLLAL
jgi:hypothetical protein